MGNQTELKVGEIVKLKSGGPEMTINSLNKDYNTTAGEYTDEVVSITVQWFAGKKLVKGTFPLDSVSTVDKESE